jgi:hypothetical protein
MKKHNRNYHIAGMRNLVNGRIAYLKNGLTSLIIEQNNKKDKTMTSDEVFKLHQAMNVLCDIQKNWKSNYDQIRKHYNMKTYEKV